MPPVRQLALLDTFRCLGPDCVATCCSGWRIVVDPPTEAHWVATGETAALAAREVDEGGTYLRLDHRGCVLLTEEGWCSVQRRGGEPALPHGCSAFPRTPRAWPDGVEVTATMGCPEVARLALADDAALGWVSAGVQAVPRKQVVLPSGTEADQRAARKVQAAVVALAADSTWPLRVRLLQIVAAIVPLQGPAPTSFVAAARHLDGLSASWRSDVAAWSGLLQVPLPAALAWIDGALRARLQAPGVDGLGELGRRLGPLPEHVERIAARAQSEDSVLAPLFARHLRYLAIEHPAEGDPVQWLQSLLLHAAGVRCCVLATPEVPTDALGWERVVVDVAWRFARDVEHASRADAEASTWTAPATLRSLGALAVLTAV